MLHHAVTDGWSTSLICRELTTSYNAFVNGQQPAHPPLAVQYADYGGWQRTWLKQNLMQSQVLLAFKLWCPSGTLQALTLHVACTSVAQDWCAQLHRPLQPQVLSCLWPEGETNTLQALLTTPDWLQLNFWREALAGAPMLWSFPTDFTRPAYPSGKGARVVCTIPPSDVQGLRQLAAQARPLLCLCWQGCIVASLSMPCGAKVHRPCTM